MVTLYIAGKKVGTLAEADQLLTQLQQRQEIELRDDNGKLLGRVVPANEPLCPWEPLLTKEDIDRRIAEGGGIKLSEFWDRMKNK